MLSFGCNTVDSHFFRVASGKSHGLNNHINGAEFDKITYEFSGNGVLFHIVAFRMLLHIVDNETYTHLGVEKHFS